MYTPHTRALLLHGWWCRGEALGRMVEQGGGFRETTPDSIPLTMVTSVNKLLYLNLVFLFSIYNC